MATLSRVVIVGASLAGLRAAETLRRKGYDGRLVLIGAEPHEPYDRPPLSKEILQGVREPERLALRKHSYAELALELRLGTRATALDLQARSVALADGTSEPFDGLIIATGARARALPNQPKLAGLHLLRTLEDSLAIRDALAAGPRVLVVGAGFIGAEVAASCRMRGLEVTVIEPQPVPLLRGLGPKLGSVCAQLHLDHGVDLRCGVGVDGFEGEQRIEAVRLADGTRVPADLVVVGIGAAPETQWLEGSGLDLQDGVLCDSSCATRAPGVLAAGDVARWLNPRFDEQMRVEHWSNAVEQGVYAAERLLAGSEPFAPFAPVPSFWSDQYDVKIQFAGRMRADDEMRVVRGKLEERRFTVLYGRAGRLVGVLAFNRPRDIVRYKRMIFEAASFEQALAQQEA